MLAISAGVVMCLTIVTFTVRNRAEVARGGDVWIHGDWLVSFAAGPVRRGASGEIVFWISDALGIGTLNVVETIQGGALVALVAACLVALVRLDFNERISILLMSPAFVLFWHNEFLTHGKEIFAALAFLPMVVAAMRERFLVAAHGLSVLVYGTAASLHEAALFFAPFLLLCSYVLCARQAALQLTVAFAAALCVLGLSVAVFVVAFQSLADIGPLCAEILRRGINEEVCGTSIGWLLNDVDRALEFTASKAASRNWTLVIVAGFLAYMPVFVILRPAFPARWRLIGIAATVALFVPLYVVAIDYGRWLNMQIVAVTFTIIVAAMANALPALDRPMARWMAYTLAGLTLLWRLPVASGGIGSGVLEPVVRAVLGAVGIVV